MTFIIEQQPKFGLNYGLNYEKKKTKICRPARAIPAKVDVVLEIVIRAVPGDFVRVSLSSVALLTGVIYLSLY